MSAATDRLAAITAAAFANGGHRSAFPQACNDIGTVGDDVADDAAQAASNALATAADRSQTGVDRAATAADRVATAALVPIAADSTAGRRLNDTGQWSVVRASPAWGFNSRGLFEETLTDTLRWEFDTVSLAPLGAAFAPARTNSITNPRAEGAVAGTPGTLPTGWGSRPTGAPTTEVVGITTRQGVPGLLMRFAGVPTSTGPQTWQMNGSISHTVGLVLCTSIYVELVAGSLTNVRSFSIRNNLANDAGTNFTPGALSRISRVWTSTVSPATPGIRWAYDDTITPVDFTLFIGAPSLEIGVPYASPPILPPVGSPGVSTRAQGTVDIPVRNLGTRYNRRAGTIIVDWNSQPGVFSSANDLDFMTMVSLGDLGANEVMGMLINPQHASVVFRRTVGGVAQTTANVAITPPAAGQTIRCAFAWDIDAGVMQVAARGTAGTQLTGQTSIPVITHIMPGRFSTTRPLSGQIAGIEIRPAGVFGASLAALT